MPSPVKPSDFCSLAPTPATEPCEAIRRLFFDYPALMCQLITYMFDENGEVTEDFFADVATVPPGVIVGYGGVTAPSGWLLCDGREVSRTTYAALYSAIGTIYGDGDGGTTFNLPDARRRVLVGYAAGDAVYNVGEDGGEETHSLTDEEVPAGSEHQHGVGLFDRTSNNDTRWYLGEWTAPEAFTGRHQNGEDETFGSTNYDEGDVFPSSRGITTSTVVTDTTVIGHNNMQPYFVAAMIIKT